MNVPFVVLGDGGSGGHVGDLDDESKIAIFSPFFPPLPKASPCPLIVKKKMCNIHEFTVVSEQRQA